MTAGNDVDGRAGRLSRAGRFKTLVPIGIIFAVLLLDLVYVSRPAFVWDETYYFSFSTGVRRWFAAPTLDEATINAVFREGNAHPPLPIYVMAVTGGLLRADLGDFLLAVRLATALQFAALVLVVYLFLAREAGAAAAAFAAALTALSPRLFAHSLVATYDVPMCLWWVATTVAFYKGMQSRRWACASGFVFGLALLTKVNALLLPLALWPWGFYFHRRRALPAVISMCTAGPLVFFAGWPWLWLHPVHNLAEYVVDKFPAGAVPSFVLSWTGTQAIGWREAARTLYFGSVRPGGAPWHYPFVMFVFTMPLAALAGSLLCAVDARRRREVRPLAVLLWWSILVQLVVFALAMTPFDGVRLFLAVLPLSAMAAGLGLARLWTRGALGAVAAAALVCLSPGAEFLVYEPYGMSYYTPLIGGLPGADALGMEVTYYGEAISPSDFAAINSRAVAGQRVAYAPLFEKLPLRLPYEYVRYGYLRLGLEPAAPWDDWDYLIFVNRGGLIGEGDREALARGRVIHENHLLGVTLTKVLEKGSNLEEAPDAFGQP